MAFTVQLGSLTLSVLNDPGFQPGYPELTEKGRRKAAAGLPIDDSDYENRTVTFEHLIKESSLAAREAAYRSILAEVLPTPDSTTNTNTLTFNPGGSSNDLTATFYRGLSRVEILDWSEPDQRTYTYRVRIELVCQPFFTGPTVDLHRNYIKDSKMWEDFDGDGICNSFTKTTSGTAPTHTVSIDDGQKLDVTSSSGSGEYVQIQQTISDIDGGETWSYRIEYKATAHTNAIYEIYIIYDDGASTVHYLKQYGTAAVSDWTELKLENQTVPAGATQGTLRMRISSTAASASGTLWCRKAMAVNAASLQTGKDGNTIWHESEVAESPSVFQVDNIPGDVSAKAIIQVGSNDSHGYTDEDDYWIVGKRARSLEAGQELVFSFFGTSDSSAHGGAYEAVAHGSYARASNFATDDEYGVYIVWARMKTDSTTATSDKFHFKALPVAALIEWPEILSDSVKPFEDSGSGKWVIAPLGALCIPPYNRLSGVNERINLDIYSEGGSGGSWYIDYVCLQPVDGENFTAPAGSTNDYMDKVTAVSDTISNKPGLWIQDNTDFPFAVSSGGEQFAWPAAWEGQLLTLNPGTSNLAVCVSRTDGTDMQVNDALISVRYQPRYLLAE